MKTVTSKSGTMEAMIDQLASQNATTILENIQARVREQTELKVQAGLGQLVSGTTAPAKVVKAAGTGTAKRGPKKGSTATKKGCPVCGVLNTRRRVSYLCDAHTNPANAAKYKGSSKAA